MSTAKTRNKKKKASHPTASCLIARFNEKSQKQPDNWNRNNPYPPNSQKTSYNKSDLNDDTELTKDTKAHKLTKKQYKKRKNIPPPPKTDSNKSIPPPPPSPPPSPPPYSSSTNKTTKTPPKNKQFTKTKPSLTRQPPSQPTQIFTFNQPSADQLEEYDTFDESETNNYKAISLPQSLNNEQTSLQDLHDIILLYQQAVHDVHQAIVDVKQSSQDITYKVKSVTEQLHIIIDRREDELLDEITKKTASKIFALDTQFTKLTQRLMFCREARDEAESLLAKHYEYNDSEKPISKVTGKNQIKTRDHSSGSVGNYNMRKDRIMNIVNKTKQDAKNEFESELNRGTPVVNTRFHVEEYDITQELETLGTIIDDMPVQQFQLYPPAIIKTKAYTKSIRIGIKSREKIETNCEYQVLACQFEPQLVLINSKETLNNPETLNWQSLGWIELNPAPIATQMDTKSNQMTENKSIVIEKWNDNENEMQVDDQASAPMETMSNLEKLKKELDLDHITTEYTKLITGLNDILIDVDDKCIYIRVRMRKLVKFEDDEDDKDVAPIWIESHFSRPVRLFIRDQVGGGALPSLVDLADDIFEDFDAIKEKSRRKKRKNKKKKKKRRHAKSKNSPIYVSPVPSMDTMPEDTYGNHGIKKPKLPLLQHSGSLYEHDSEFTKQRRHSNYHIQDDLYEPGILILTKSNIIWHDIVNNRDNIVSDKIPVSARSSCSMVVAHDVLVADDHNEEDQDTKTDNKEERYTSIMFRIGGTLNKKTERSVDMLDLTTGMWSNLPSLKHSRSWCEPALMNGNIVCAGGCGKKSKPLSSVELFDFEESGWRELKSLQQSRWGHAVYVMYYQDNDEIARSPVTPSVGGRDICNESSKLIVAGGWSKKKKNLHTAEIYDITRNKWEFIAPMNIARCRCVAMEWTSIDRVGVIGGWGDDTNKIVEYYDSEKDAWYRLNDLNYEHVYPSCGLLSDQHLYAMNRFLEQDAKQIINNHKISLMKGRPQPFVLGSNDQLSCLELFDDRVGEWIILQTFARSQNNIICMIECALPNDVTATLAQRGRGYSNVRRGSESYSRSSLWQRRGSKIIGML